MAKLNKALEKVLRELGENSDDFFRAVGTSARKIDDLSDVDIKKISDNFIDYLKLDNRKSQNVLTSAQQYTRNTIGKAYDDNLIRQQELKNRLKNKYIDAETGNPKRYTKRDLLSGEEERLLNNEKWMNKWQESQNASKAVPTPEPKKYKVNGKEMTMEEIRAAREVNKSMPNPEEVYANRINELNNSVEKNAVDRTAGIKAAEDYRSGKSKTYEDTTIRMTDATPEEIAERNKRAQDYINSKKSNNMNDRLNARAAEKQAKKEAAEEAAAAAETESVRKSVDTETIRKASKKDGGIYDYVYNREASKYDYENIKKGFTDNDELRKHVSGLTGKSVDDLGSDEAMEAALSAKLHDRASNPSWIDKAGYRKYPQLAAGIGTTAWLVSRLSESKGQMSNAQLYGQQPY